MNSRYKPQNVRLVARFEFNKLIPYVRTVPTALSDPQGYQEFTMINNAINVQESRDYDTQL